MNKKIIISLVLVALMGFGTALGTYAWFTSQATSAENTFTAGKLKVELKGNTTAASEFTLGGNLQPGDFITSGTDNYAYIELENTENLDLATFFRFTVTEDNGREVEGVTYKLADKIIIDSMKMEFLSPEGEGDWEPVDQFITNGTGSGNWPTHYTNLAGADGKISLTEWISRANNGMGMYYGWQEGALKPNHKYRLTFRFKFDESANDKYQGLALKGKFEAYATQVRLGAVEKLIDDLDIELVGTAASHYNWFNLQLAKQ